MLHISSLPDDGLRLILEQLPLEQLLTIRWVCPRWNAIVVGMLRTVLRLRLYESMIDLQEHHAMRYYFMESTEDSASTSLGCFANHHRVLILGMRFDSNL